MIAMPRLDPNDFIDTDAAFEEDYDPDEISHAEFTIVPGDEVNHASLVYWADGIEGTRQKWGISMYYGYQYNGPDIPIDEQSARDILRNLASHDEPEDFDWVAHDWAYFE